jgi:hypothetical protein
MYVAHVDSFLFISHMRLVPSIIKSHFSWTWQCSTLNRSDELVSLLMACIQPFYLHLPNYTEHNGQISSVNREIFGVLALFHETKTAQPGVTIFLCSRTNIAN